jgi:hypothetical protein
MKATNTLTWIIGVCLWALALIFGSCALTACGGAAFVYDPGASPDAEALEASPEADAAPEADAKKLGDPHPDAGTEPDVGADASPPETDAGSEGGCDPAPTALDCLPTGADAGISYTAPAQYCVWLYDEALNPPAAPVIMQTPAACACDYTTACLGVMPCPEGSHYYAGGLIDNGGKIVCQKGDGG